MANYVVLPAVSLLFLLVWLTGSKRRRLETPGPRRLPLVGNLFTGIVHEQMAAFANEFGSIFSVNLFGTDAIVVTSVSAARELFVKRSATYATRLPLKMVELCNFHQGLLFQPDANKLRQGRRLLLKGMARRELEQYQDIIQHHTLALLSRLLAEPDDFMNHIQTSMGDLSLEIGYGHRSTGKDDVLARRSKDWVTNFTSTIAFGGFLVNVFPILDRLPEWCPGAPHKKTANAWRKDADNFRRDAYEMVKRAVNTGDGQPSIISKTLTEFRHALDEDVIINSAAQMLTGGHTTVLTLQTFMLAMVLHPEAQEKAKEEIHRVVGSDRLPTFSDWDDLPYTTGIVREVLRWHPVIPLLPRNPIQDDLLNGHFVPKDTMVIVNYWAMLHDEVIFPDHAAFRPERWSELKIDRTNDPFEIAFGFGRRVCPGRAATKELLFTIIASIIATFKISKAKDAHGNEITPPEEFTSGGVIGPVPFKCHIEPRSRVSSQLIAESIQSARIRA
ncbi:cytochrome P450 [Cristinia sonorae]|uniref:Cytochrome P450 n=1 Tax=Cristinia sonorae TaxID=1940300 RepID=A0A8K0UI42_9AGAR|nr:cytochrome P450 [Cristinia sonorae]